MDPHYEKIKARVSRFPDIVEKNLLGFNEPRTHRHTVKPIDISSLISEVTKLTIYLEREYMFSSHKKPLVDIISSACKCICNYNDYLQVQRIRASKNCENEVTESSEDYSLRKIKQLYDHKPYVNYLSSLKADLIRTSQSI